jgi:hypothetical protein
VKKFFLFLIAIVAVLALLAYLNRSTLGFYTMMFLLKPDHAFADAPPPAAPDYRQRDRWAALPDQDDLADTLVPGAVDRQANAAVDVFFVHPTTYYRSDSWNQPLDDRLANAITDGAVLRGQASVFNSAGAIYAPRYRQATLYAFLDDTASGPAALRVAYQDVLAAFDYFLEHYSHGRPFILAGHSQGSRHLVPLVRDRIAGGPLRERLVAVYAVGYAIKAHELPADVSVCDHADQIGCLVTWNSVGPDAARFGDPGADICVNPLTWLADGNHADFAENLGAVSFGAFGFSANPDPTALLAPRTVVVEPGAADGQCIDGRLLVSDIRSANFGAEPMGEDNYHIYDYALFYMNIRANAEARAAAYLAAATAANAHEAELMMPEPAPVN